NNKGHLSEYRTRHLFHQIVTAVQYIHSNDLSHRDLKCENILLKDELTVRITDFGFARSCRDKYTNQRILSDTFCGSAAYAAPEILQGLPYNPKMYDVWSLGCILYIMLTARMPYDDSNITKMLYVQLHAILSFPTKSEFKISHDMKKFIMHLLEPDVTRRATINQVYTELTQLPPITPQNCVKPKNSVQKLTGKKSIGQAEMDYLRMKLKKCKIPHNF
ncbi:testis-specific serine/threonine-protein kinase 1-like, partial [Nilaparvata lugens]|uniref:testis-specific serine/threonine-protein kinase 1-like n=1 Tax=Nilaparvata lugens TaxID=108931 RepID=UPI00193DA377